MRIMRTLIVYITIGAALIQFAASLTNNMCPNSWHVMKDDENVIRCMKFYGRSAKKSWFQSEVHCRDVGGHLATVESHQSMKLLWEALGTSRYSHSWFGLRLIESDLKYSNGVSFGKTRDVVKLPAFNESIRKTCLSIRTNITVAEQCNTLLPLTCSIPVRDLDYKSLQLFFTGADFGEIGPTPNSNIITRVTTSGLVIHDGVEVGLGKWLTDTVFMSKYPSGLPCIWVVDVEKMTTGCDYGRKTLFKWKIQPKWFPIPGSLITPNNNDPVPDKVPITVSETYSFGSVLSEDKSSVEGPPNWAWPIIMGLVVLGITLAVVGGVRKKKRGKKRSNSNPENKNSNGETETGKLPGSSESDFPYSMSALNSILLSFDDQFDYSNESDEVDFVRLDNQNATVPHSVNSVLHLILDSDSEVEKIKTSASTKPTGNTPITSDTSDEVSAQSESKRKKIIKPSNIPVEDCEICKNFDKVSNTDRLRRIHADLSNELKAPLRITGASCEHVDNNSGEHIHTFKVDNEFSLFLLGVLSTGYTRAKPRLPRNTRIHVLYNKA